MALFNASLVIGGTGMLARATSWLADRSAETLLVARRATSFNASCGAISAVDADWGSASFAPVVEAALERSPPIEAALLWLHKPDAIIPWLWPKLRNARIVLVLGSIDGQPQLPEIAGEIAAVRLGSVKTSHGRRWLTHDEISTGAIASLQDGRSRIVGELAAVG